MQYDAPLLEQSDRPKCSNFHKALIVQHFFQPKDSTSMDKKKQHLP